MENDPIRSGRRLRALQRSGLLARLPEKPFDQLVSLARELIQVPIAMVTVADAERSYWKATAGVDGSEAEQPIEDSFCQYVVREGRPLVLEDARLDERTRDNRSVTERGVVACAAYPLRSPDGDVLGTFCLFDTEPRQWTLMELRLLKTLSLAASNEVALRLRVGHSEQGLRSAEQDRDAMQRLASDAVAQAQVAHEVSLAVQHALLTTPDVDDGLDVAARYLAARADNTVGGDWYDVFPRADGTTTLVVGDVSGHDVDAMAAMGQVRGFVRAIGFDAVSPAEVLRRVDRVMAGMQVPGVVTAVVAQLGPADRTGSRTLSWTNAGHVPPLLHLADGRVETLTRPHDLLLGVSGAAERNDHEITVPPGSTVLLYTDGLVDRADVPTQAGISWLAEALAGAVDRSVHEMADLVLDGVRGRARDDVVVLAVRGQGPADAVTSSLAHSEGIQSNAEEALVGADDKMDNTMDKLGGKAKEAEGKATGDQARENQGKGEQSASDLKQAGEKVKDAFKS